MEGHHAKQLKWLTLFRVALITVLLIATVVFNLQDTTNVSDRLYVYLYYLCTAVFVLSFGYTIAIRFMKTDRQLLLLTYAQFTGDILFASALVLVTGGTDSAFTFFFSLVIIGGAIVLFRMGAIYIASLSTLVLLAIGLMEIDVLPYVDALDEYRISFLPNDPALSADPLDEIDRTYRMVYNVSVNALAFFGVGFLASWLSEQLRRSAQEIRTQARSLQELRALHRHIVSSVPTGLVTIDNEHRITSFNSSAETITGLTVEQVLGYPLADFFRDLKYVLDNPKKLGGVQREESIIIVNRRRRYLGWSISPLLKASGEPIGFIFMFQDITRVKELERQSYRAEKLAAIGELSAAIAHEIRNPLAAISGSIQLLKNNVKLGGTDKRLMDIVIRETEQLNRWITDFLDYSRPPPMDRKALDITRLIDDTLTVARQDEKMNGITVERQGTDPVWVLGDEARLRQVLWNLLMNAAQAMPGDGILAVAVESVDNGSRPLVEIKVSDTGCGIPPDEQDRVFQPFFTTKERGTGLGLAVVHQIVSHHDGRIDLESEVDKGTTFRLLLPLSLPPVTSPAPASSHMLEV